MLKNNYFYILLLNAFFFTSCINNMPIPKQSIIINPNDDNKKSLKLKQSNRGKYLYGMLVGKMSTHFVKQIKVNELYDKNKYELIKVYQLTQKYNGEYGVYPSYEPNNIEKHKDSIFRDTTFDDLGNLNKGGVSGKVVDSTDFDKTKFKKIAEQAMLKMYRNTKLTIKINTPKEINREFSTIIVELAHKPNTELNKIVFGINKSEMYAQQIKSEFISPILEKRTYQLGIPTGKNVIEVKASSKEGEKANDKTLVNNKFKAKPTFYIVAIGVNEFPNWATNLYLKNAVNDALYVKDTFKNKSKKLFNNKIRIQPYSLNTKDTTKQNIEALIHKISMKVKPNDYFLFYVASHGFSKKNKYYFATSDFNRLELRSNNIDEKQISEYLMYIKTIFRMAILDTCNAGKQINAIKEDIKNLDLGRKEGISLLTAAKNKQVANDAYKNTKHGLFTWTLIEGLNGAADADKDSIVDSMEIAEYVKNNVGIKARELGFEQDAMIFPEPSSTIGRRFELTYLEKKKFKGFNPNIFTPRESQLYINAINTKNSSMMEGLKRNNTRHRLDVKTKSLKANEITVSNIINALKSSAQSVDIALLFRSNSSTLNNLEVKKLNIIAEALKSNELRDKKVIVEGHTDSTGEEFNNMILSQNRADSVSKILSTSFNISKNRLVTIGFGDMFPIASNKTSLGKQKNRRVSIFIYD